MNVLITICGRAGSKGVKNKNIREFFGFPLIKFTLAVAEMYRLENETHLVDIAVNSDSDDLLAMAASRHKVSVVKRNPEFAQDSSPKLPVIRETLLAMEKENNLKYEYVIDLDITSPFRGLIDIVNGMEVLKSTEGADVAFSVVKARRNPYFNMIQVKDGLTTRIIETNFTTRQEAPTVYDMNASIYCYKRDSILLTLNNSPLDGNFTLFEMKDTGVLDIDCEEDFELMEILAKHFFENHFKREYDYLVEHF